MKSYDGIGMQPPEVLMDCLKRGDNFLIATHVNPDGDALGSAAALAMALEKMGKKAVLLDKHRVPDQYLFLPCSERFHTFESIESAGFKMSDFNTLIVLDCNDTDRIGLGNKQQQPFAEALKKALAGTMRSVVIDHHETQRSFGDIKWIEPSAAATGLMVLYLLKSLGVAITSEIAINLYAALVVDTGNFRFENATPQVFRAGAELIEYGVRPNIVYQELYESWSDNRFRLYMDVIASLEIRDDIAFSLVTKKMMEETSTTADDTENFVSFPRIMKRIDISVLLRETGRDEYKASLRSKSQVNVAHVAEFFDGGGHKNAAGCTIKADLETAKALIIEKLNGLKHS